MKIKTKTQWIVKKNEDEIARFKTKKIAQVCAAEIGGYVVAYRKEWV